MTVVSPTKLDHTQEALRIEFLQLVQNNPSAFAQKYIQRFGSVLSHRLAYKLSTNYSRSDQTRGYYSQALTESAKLMVQKTMQAILTTGPSSRPLLIIAGAGPGSGKLTAITDPLLTLKKQVLCIYDASDLTIEELQELISNTHALNIQTIVAYIDRPLPQAARSTILRNLKEGMAPDPSAFAAAHLQNFNNFLLLTKLYAKAPQLFAATVNLGSPDDIHSTKPSFLKNIAITSQQAEEIFTTVLKDISRSPSTSSFHTANSPPRKPSKAPRSGKTPFGQSTKIGYLLAQSLRSTLIKQERQTTAPPDADVHSRNLQPPAPDSSAPTKTLIHVRNFATKDETLEITGTQGQTLKGQEKALNNERPVRTLVRETSTHIHEMETILVR